MTYNTLVYITIMTILTRFLASQPPGHHRPPGGPQEPSGPGYFKLGITRLYNPNYGFKQYWPGGGWAMMKVPPTSKPKTLAPNVTTIPTTTTPIPPTVCGEDCPQGFRHIKEVCVRHSSKDSPKLDEFHTFPTYCEYLAKADFGCIPRKYWGWIFIHTGPCMEQQTHQKHPVESWTYNEDTHMASVQSRLDKFLKKFRDPEAWTLHYSGLPYNVTPFQNLPDF